MQVGQTKIELASVADGSSARCVTLRCSMYTRRLPHALTPCCLLAFLHSKHRMCFVVKCDQSNSGRRGSLFAMAARKLSRGKGAADEAGAGAFDVEIVMTMSVTRGG